MRYQSRSHGIVQPAHSKGTGRNGGGDVPGAEFDAMLRRLKPDVVVVTSMDST